MGYFKNFKWGKRIAILLTGLVILGILFIIFYPPISYKIYKDWWKTYDPDGKYNCLDLNSLAYWQFSYGVYKIRQLIASGGKHIENDAWLLFITSLMYSNAKGLVPGGITTPRNICHSLVPENNPNKLIKWPTTKDGEYGWKNTIKTWGSITFDKTKKEYKYDSTAWQAEEDNFLYNDWAIPGDSPIVMAFVTGWNADEAGVALYPEAITPLLGLTGGEQAGGWWGFLQGGGDFKDMGVDEMRRLVWAEDLNAVQRFQSGGEAHGTQPGESTGAQVMKYASFAMSTAMCIAMFL